MLSVFYTFMIRRFADIPELRKFGLVTPDIEVAFDAAVWNNGAGPDNQLDRALQWGRNGN